MSASKHLTAKVLSIVTDCISSAIVHNGYGRHVYYLTPDQLTAIRKLQFGNMLAGSIALCTARISFAVSLLWLMGTNTTRRMFLWFIIVQHVAIIAVSTLMTMFYCQPVKKFWYPKIPGKCMDPLPRKNVGYALHGKLIADGMSRV